VIAVLQGLMSLMGGTRAGGAAGVDRFGTGRVVSKSHMSVTGHKVFLPQGSCPEILRNGWPMESRWGAMRSSVVLNKLKLQELSW